MGHTCHFRIRKQDPNNVSPLYTREDDVFLLRGEILLELRGVDVGPDFFPLSTGTGVSDSGR